MTLSTEDTLAIQQLYARYNHAIDLGDASGWAGCFTADGTFTSASGNFAGHGQLAAFAEGFSRRIRARHWTNNLVLEPAEDGAAGKCYLMLLRLGDADTSTSILTTAIYEDALVRQDDGWKFKSRNVKGDA